MTLPVPVEPTLAPGQTVTSAWANASVRDAINFLIAKPVAVISQTTAQTVANVTISAITMDTTTFDSYGGHSNTVNPSRYTCQLAGWYFMLGTIEWASSATGNRLTQLYHNGILFSPGGVGPAAGSANSPSLQGAALVNLAVGDYIEVFGYQTSGGNLATLTTGSSMHVFWVHS